MAKNFKGLCFGDVHLGHANTPTLSTVEALEKLVNNHPQISEIKLILIEGDLWDRLLSYNDPDIIVSENYLIKLLLVCNRYKIILRTLLGTSSHDMNQSICIAKLIDTLGIDIDYKYITEIEVEYIPSLELKIGYVPDEMHSPLSICYDVMLDKMTEKGWDKLDLLLMHGAFDYQFPSYYDVDCYDSKLWMSLVNYYILIGHIHDRSVFEKIIATGSTNRIRHGEEKPKGITEFEIKDNVASYKFIDNKNAMIYKTYTVYELLDNTIMQLDEKIAKLPLGSFVRFRCRNRIDANELVSYFEDIHPTMNFTSIVDDVVDGKKVAKSSLVYSDFKSNSAERIMLNKDNTKPLLLEEFSKGKLGSKLNRAKELLETIG